jgi:hypothetical protein
MWCSVCQSDVAIEVGADHRRVTCSMCGTVLGETAASRENDPPASETQGGRVTEARDLLDRWASDHLFDPYGAPKKPVSSDQIAEETVSSQKTANDEPASAAGQQPAPPERLEDILEPPAASEMRPRWDAAHTTVRRPMNLNRRDEGHRGSRPAADQGGGVAETSRRSQSPASQIPSQPSGPPRSQAATDTPSESGKGDGLAASAEELDRLTNEILSRVSRITNQREAASQPAAPQEPPQPPVSEEAAVAEADSMADGNQRSESGDTWNLAPVDQPAEPAGDNESSYSERDDAALSNAGNEEPAGSYQRVPRPHAAAFTQRVDAPHQPAEPHADFSYGHEKVSAAADEISEEDATNWFSGLGQGLAWLGILGLTAGTSLVIVGYFGGPATYAPMGWLISTIGQMLLFLGIVTLVSSGMEQTTQEVRRTVNEVSRKLDLIEDRIVRIDAAAAPGPPRPHIADRMVKATSDQRTREETAGR